MQSSNPKLYGVDLSHANPDVDLHQLVAAGSLTFIGLKATEGKSFIDATFIDRFKRIRDYLPSTLVIAYHFLRIDSDPADQMRHFYDVLAGVGYSDHENALTPAVDAERGLQGQEPSATDVVEALTAFKKLAGFTPGLYSGLDYWRTHFGETVQPRYRWVARYADTPPSLAYDIWQDSEARLIAANKYDHNVAFMTLAQFVARVGRV
jgi:GH25 family lysozyme M1 (1,4-beta-N-acetylmuramidase)